MYLVSQSETNCHENSQVLNEKKKNKAMEKNLEWALKE